MPLWTGGTHYFMSREVLYMAQMGRPPKYSPELVQRLSMHVSYGCPRKVAAEVEGIHEKTFERWMDEKPDFYETIVSAEARARATLVACLQKQARNGSTKAASWLLERLLPKDFGPPAQQIDVTMNLGDLPDDALDQLVDGRRPAITALTGRSGEGEAS